MMKQYRLFWAPTGAILCEVQATTPSAAKRKAASAYRKYLGEIIAEEIIPLAQITLETSLARLLELSGDERMKAWGGGERTKMWIQGIPNQFDDHNAPSTHYLACLDQAGWVVTERISNIMNTAWRLRLVHVSAHEETPNAK